MNIIDSHIHLDKYSDSDRAALLQGREAAAVSGLISVSMDLASAQNNLLLSRKHQHVYPAFGFHPEQRLPADNKVEELAGWIKQHSAEMVAVGEVGLPYYLRQEAAGAEFPYSGYVELLEQFIKLAGQLMKPVVLHAVYDDAPVVCDLLERNNLQHAHFHWFKGDMQTVQRMAGNGYMISITPDVLYEGEIQELASKYPLAQMMVETDGPWPFEGPFSGQVTNPAMMHETVKMISKLKRLPLVEVYGQLYQNTVEFYRLEGQLSR